MRGTEFGVAMSDQDRSIEFRTEISIGCLRESGAGFKTEISFCEACKIMRTKTMAQISSDVFPSCERDCYRKII
jgi:hypothetical protein